MYKILLINNGGENAKLDLRQTPNGSAVIGNYHFFINEPIEDPDIVVIRGKALKKTTYFNVAPKNTILLTSEPYSVLAYPEGYCKQFGLVCSCQANIKLPNVVYTQAMLPWFVGIAFENGTERVRLNYEQMKSADKPEKKKLISVITSNKAFTRGHQRRLDFVARLKEHYGDKIDVFGRGFCEFSDKWDVLAPYKYHIAIENSSSPYYWTEKVADCFLAQAFPLYYGCTNLEDYFPKGSYQPIDIDNFQETVKIIDDIIARDRYEEALPALRESRALVLDDYNMFNMIVRHCESLDMDLKKERYRIKPAGKYFSFHNFYLHTVSRSFFKIRKALGLSTSV